jgi:hypothetical protein
VTTGFLVGVAGIAAALLFWIPIRRWYQRSDARRLAPARAMSGDADMLAPDYESTLAIVVAAPPAAVWDALLRFGWPRKGRRTYERLGRLFGFLEPMHPVSANEPAAIPVGADSQIPVRTVLPARTLVLGSTTGSREWAWQFEVSAMDEGRTRLILRDRARGLAALPAWLSLAIPRALSFVLTRKMLLDIKTAAEARRPGVALP